MKLSDFTKNQSLVLDMQAIADDTELVREIQHQLMLDGLLDPPVDGRFGKVSGWALSAFAQLIDLGMGQALDAKLAAALIDMVSDRLLPIDTSAGDLATQLVAGMEGCDHWIARHPECMNIIYVEGINPNGELNENAPNQFNDTRFVLRITANGTPEILGAWQCTTEPGRHYTEHPLNKEGAARIAFGQYKAWIVGKHRGHHEALIQAADISIFRDHDRNYSRLGDKSSTGMFGINQHGGYNMPTGNIGESSAGCLVGRDMREHGEFMALIKRDPRYLATPAYRFMSTILSVKVSAVFRPRVGWRLPGKPKASDRRFCSVDVRRRSL